MVRYVLKRLLLFIPTLFAILVITFLISLNTPGDPVALMMQSKGEDGSSLFLQRQDEYQAKRKSLGLDLPIFYFSMRPAFYPDTLDRIPVAQHRKTIKRLIHKYGDWPLIERWYHTCVHLGQSLYDASSSPSIVEARKLVPELLREHEDEAVGRLLAKLSVISWNTEEQTLSEQLKAAHGAWNQVTESQDGRGLSTPSFQWHGGKNQFHRWLFGSPSKDGLIQGDLGVSYRSGRPVTQEIGGAVQTTLWLSLMAVFLTFLIALPLGVFTAARQGTSLDRGIHVGLFGLYSLPVFWVGTLLIVFLGGGDFLNWFPAYGLGNLRGLNGFEAILKRAHHLILPIFCLVYPTLAVLARQTRGSMIEVLGQDYIRTARAKGLPEKQITWRHGFRNGLLPIITLLAGIFPFAIAGSVVVEVVFSINGMGKLALDALYARDYPVVYGFVLVAAFMTLLGYLVSDLLYAWADPRIRLGGTKNGGSQ